MEIGTLLVHVDLMCVVFGWVKTKTVDLKIILFGREEVLLLLFALVQTSLSYAPGDFF